MGDRGLSVCGKETRRWWGRRLEGRKRREERVRNVRWVGGWILRALVRRVEGGEWGGLVSGLFSMALLLKLRVNKDIPSDISS